MTAKLTLSVDPEVVARAKRYAAQTGTSVSRLVEDYLAALVTGPEEGRSTPPVLEALRGSMQTGTIEDYREYQQEKYKV